MSDDDLKAELERLRRENEGLKRGRERGLSLKGERERGSVGLRTGTLPRDPIQRAMGSVARHH